MAWNGVVTWGAGPWTFSDANTYIRDNMTSIRRYQNSVASYSGAGTIGVSGTQVGAAQTALCTSTPDEATLTLVIVSFIFGPTSAGGTVTVDVRDQTSAIVSGTGNLTVGAGEYGTIPSIGVINAASGTNPGFSVRAAVTVGTCPCKWTAAVFPMPVT